MGKQKNFAHINAHAAFDAILNHFDLEYTRKGDQLRLRCPFHDDDNPSLSITLVDTDKAKANTFHCFGCGVKGSPIDFVRHHENNALREAAAQVAEISGCTLAPPRGGGAKRQKPKKRQTGAERPTDGHKAKSAPNPAEDSGTSCSYRAPRRNEPLKFSFELDHHHDAVLRRLDPEAAELFGVGLLPDTRRSMMKGRICIPIHNSSGELVAYAVEKLAELYNVHRLNGAQHIVAVEGFFSAMRLDQLGVPTVALMGTAISIEQIELLLARGVKSVLVLLDGDEPGRKAAIAVAAALAPHLFVRIVTLPDDGAPDDVPESVLQRHLPFPLRNRL